MKSHYANCELGDKCTCDEPTCCECGCEVDLVHDDDGDTICCDCLFERETQEINQP